jgi:hypothetical protein
MVIRTVTTQDQSQKAKRDAEEEKELFRREEVDAKQSRLHLFYAFMIQRMVQFTRPRRT